MERVTLVPSALLSAIQNGGSPVTHQYFEERFKTLMEDLFLHKQTERVRIVIESDHNEP